MNDNMKIVEKAKKIIAESETMYIAYIREDGYPRVSTITMMKADGIKSIFTSTAIDGSKTKRIQANPKVSLCFCNGCDNITIPELLRFRKTTNCVRNCGKIGVGNTFLMAQ